MTSRRGFLLASLLAPALARGAGSVRFASHPFTLGIASGYPTSDGVALWTRLAPSPLDGGGMAPDPVRVAWEVAEDHAFKRIARKGSAVAVPENAHAVHAEVDGLLPAREYFYRFMVGNEVSAVGRTRTAPEAGKGDRLRIAVGSCQQYEQGWFVAHRHLAAEGADLVLFVGDYIYESSWGRDHVRKHHQPEPKTLAQYRDRYALYKSDADLQKSHAAAPWIVTWDDHEVDNDYADDRSEDLDPHFLARRAAAYKAFYEHMPLRRSTLLAGGGMRIYGALDWGGLARFHILDDRQYRSHQACPRANRGGSATVGAECTDRLDLRLTLLGAEQERWLDGSLAQSKAAWNVIVQQTLFVPAGRRNDKGALVHWTDSWDGYPAARERMLRTLSERRPANPLIVGGDVHAAMMARVHADFANPDSPVIASELVATSITSQGFAGMINGMKRENPYIQHADHAKRGYAVMDLDTARAEARLRAVDSEKRADAGISTAAAFAIESGKPGWIAK